jgi:hypothetical protein
MALQGRILELVDIDMATGGTYETDVYMFKRKFEIAGLDDATIHNMILKQVEGQKQQFISLGLTEEEADDRIEELIEIESEPLQEEAYVKEPIVKEEK